MDIWAVNSVIEEHRPLPALSSLPVVVQNRNGESNFCWFNYYLDQSDDELYIAVRSILTLDGDMVVQETQVDLNLTAKIEEFEEPEIEHSKYLALVEEQFDNYDVEKMQEILVRAEIAPLLIAYKTVSDHISREEQ